MSMLKHDIFIGFQITHRNSAAEFKDVWMFFAQKPSHVREEEATSDIVGISIGIGVFVVNSMVSGPFVYALNGKACMKFNFKLNGLTKVGSYLFCNDIDWKYSNNIFNAVFVLYELCENNLLLEILMDTIKHC